MSPYPMVESVMTDQYNEAAYKSSGGLPANPIASTQVSSGMRSCSTHPPST